MRPGTTIAGRFVVLSSGYREPTIAVIRPTMERVRVIELEPYYFLDIAAAEEQARVVEALDDPVLLAPLHASPLVIPCHGPTRSAERTRLVDATLELVAAVGRAMRAGISVDSTSAFFDQRGQLRLPAPSTASALHIDHHFDHEPGFEQRWRVYRVHHWLEQRVEGELPTPSEHENWEEAFVDPRTYALALSEWASDPHTARERAEALEPWPEHIDYTIDFDRGIELGEAARLEDHDVFGGSYTDIPLAAAYHHRACVRWHEGLEEGARADAERACELDPHTSYLTTAALIGAGDPGERHDAAIAAIQTDDEDDYREIYDSDEQIARDAARAHHARAVYRLERGERDGAIEDLRAALQRGPHPAAQRLLEQLER